MISYVIRAKKIMDKVSNNYRKLHGEPMKRWSQLTKIYNARAKRAAKIYNAWLDSHGN